MSKSGNNNKGLKFAGKIMVLAGALASLHATASPMVSWTTNDTQVYGTTNGFESKGTLATNAVLTNQFATTGIVFGGTARANGCGVVASTGWSMYGLTGQNYVNTFGPGCTTNSVLDTLKMSFSSDLSRLAMDAYSYDGIQSDMVQLFNDGVMVGSYQLSGVAYSGIEAGQYATIDGRQFMNYANTRAGILTIDGNGTLFDELRFVESAAGAQNGDYTFFDNVRYNAAAATVPEPSSLALVMLALLGAGATARAVRRRAQASI